MFAEKRGNNQGVIQITKGHLKQDADATEITVTKESPVSAQLDGGHRYANWRKHVIICVIWRMCWSEGVEVRVLKRMCWSECVEVNVLKWMFWSESVEANVCVEVNVF